MAVVEDVIGSQAQDVIGESRPRSDSRPKVTGETRFAADLDIPGLLHARPVLSPYARAHLDRLETDAALAIPGVVAVLTAADLDIRGTSDMRMFHPLVRDEIVFVGEPVALVIGETETAAVDGAEAVVVHATPSEPVMDLERSMLPDSPIARPRDRSVEAESMRSAHAAVGDAETEVEDEEPMSANVIGRSHHQRGDVAAALAASAATVRRRFETSWVYQAYLEPHAAIASPTRDGGLLVEAATQGVFYTRSQLLKVFGLPASRIQVEGTTLGGAFGSKIMIAEPLAVGAALALGRPVRVALTRREDLAITNPAPGTIIELEIGATASGDLTAIRSRLLFDAGAWSEWTIEGIGAILIGGPYRWPNVDVRAFGIETNRVGTGSYRGPGGPQASFAIESAMDELADALGIDPGELRRRNLVRTDDAMTDGDPWPGLGAAECLDRILEHPLWRDRAQLPDDEGVGIGLGVWPGGREPAAALCKLDPDGTVSIVTGVVDMTGTDGSFAAIAAAEFGVPVDQVRIIHAGTESAPRSPLSGGSVITYSTGRAIVAAARQARERLLDYAATQLEISVQDLEIADGQVRPLGSPDRGISIATLADQLADFGVSHEPVEGHGATTKPSLAPAASGHLAHVRVDRETGEVTLLAYVVAQDCGRAINPALVEGQMLGGATQAIGWALLEEMRFDDDGQLVTGTFLDYAVPKARQLPPIETIIVEVPAPDGPFGAKGVGEASVCGGPGAVANAVARATGTRPTRMPITAPRIHSALSARD